MKARIIVFAALLGSTALVAGCSRKGQIEDGGVYVTRSNCPLPAILAGTGDITLFDPAGSTDARAIDVVATMTNVRAACTDDGANVTSVVSFDVVATRRDAGQARQVVLPYFDVAMQGGSTVVAKQTGNIGLGFAAGAIRASTRGQATVRISKAASTLPPNVLSELTRRRKAGDADAAVDPLSNPTIRDAVARATFEQLIGFQLNDAQLRYNATR